MTSKWVRTLFSRPVFISRQAFPPFDFRVWLFASSLIRRWLRSLVSVNSYSNEIIRNITHMLIQINRLPSQINYLFNNKTNQNFISLIPLHHFLNNSVSSIPLSSISAQPLEILFSYSFYESDAKDTSNENGGVILRKRIRLWDSK